MPDLKMCDQRKALLAAGGHLLVLGGPGSGKTTIALVKGATEIANGALAPGQKILFLSFARATVARIGSVRSSFGSPVILAGFM